MFWKFKDSSWIQDVGSCSFKIHSIFGQEVISDPVAPLQLLIGAKTHPLTGSPCEKGLYPSDFTTCPYCGSKLLEPKNSDASLWVPPYGAGNGLKIYHLKSTSSNTELPVVGKARRFPLPSIEGRFGFCTVKLDAQQRLLIALQRDNGKLWVFRPVEEKWQALNGCYCVGDNLPVWSWSLAINSSEDGLCIPTDQGPVFLTIDWPTGTIRTEGTEGKSIGGAIRLGNYLLAPVLRDDYFSIVYRKEGSSDWYECASNSESQEVLAQLRRNSDQLSFTGVPVLDENRRIAYWPCRGGYVRVYGAESSGGLTWEFRPWGTDTDTATALIELGPPYRTTGSRSGFWQLCEDHDDTVRDGIVNKIIKIDGDDQVDSQIVDCGQFLTTGQACFSWGDDYWENIDDRNPRIGEQRELRFPLLQFGEKGLVLIAKVLPWEGRDELGVFSDLFCNRFQKTTAFVRFVIEGSGVPENALYAEGVDGVQGIAKGSLFRVSLAQLLEISAFIYGDSLCVYFPENNYCYCWPLTEG